MSINICVLRVYEYLFGLDLGWTWDGDIDLVSLNVLRDFQICFVVTSSKYNLAVLISVTYRIKRMSKFFFIPNQKKM